MFINKKDFIFFVFLKIYPPGSPLLGNFFSFLFWHLQAGAAREEVRMEGWEEAAGEGSQVWVGGVQTWQGPDWLFLSVFPLAGLWLTALV